jgi:hypothetical protein
VVAGTSHGVPDNALIPLDEIDRWQSVGTDPH